MPGIDDLQDFIEERLLDFDPDMDLSDGSPVQVAVIDPLLRRFEPDPFETDLPTFIRARLQQEYPNLDAEEGDALADLLVKPMEVLMDPLIREVQFLRNNKSLAEPELLSPAEADSLMGNLFVSRQRGTKSVGEVRVFFNAPTAVSVGVGNEASTPDGLKFIPSTPQEISAEAMLFNQDGSLFYLDVSYIAEKEGDEYNVDKGAISSIANVPAAVKVTNLRRFRDGVPEETTIAFVDRGQNSLTERSLVVTRGALARLFDQFGDLQHLQVVGFNDSEMDRDIIKGGGLGPVVVFASDGLTSDDGNGDGYTGFFESPSTDFLTKVGPIGNVSGFTLTVSGVDYPIVQVVSSHIVRVTAENGGEPRLSDSLSAATFYVRENLLTLSDIPGGIINPNGTNGTIVIRQGEIHIGGVSDFYVRGTQLETADIVIEAVSDESPLISGTDLETGVVGNPADVVRFAVGRDLAAYGVRPREHSLIIETGGDAGTYQILKVAPRGLAYELQVEPAPSNPATLLKFRIVDKIDINLNEPKTVRGSRSDLKTILGSEVVSTVSAVDFAAIGGQEGDTLRIGGTSANAGDFTVDAITGTGNTLLQLSALMKKTSSSEPWSLFKLQTGIVPPVLRITSVELLDSSKQPTGDIIPYADPVDVQSFDFSNIGTGEKKTVNDARIGILGSVDLTSIAPTVNGTTIRLSINSVTTFSLPFVGVVTPQDIADQINAAAFRSIAAIVDVDGEQRLSIRSLNTWLRVLSSGNANPVLGFSTVYDEDNRQIITDSVTDWNALGIIAPRDSVYVLTGDNVGFWYLQSVEIGLGYSKLKVVNVDEEGNVRFPLSDPSATVRVGSRSFGKVRCYFMDPTSFEVRGSFRDAASKVSSPPVAGENAANIVLGEIIGDEPPRTMFRYDVFGDGSAFYEFFPDPELEHTVLPVTDEDVPNNLTVTALSDTVVSELSPAVGPGQFSRAAEVDFLLREAMPGDILEITYQPIEGIQDITSATGLTYPTDVVGKTLIFSLENGPNKTVIFTNNVTSPEKLVAEINAQLGESLAFIEDTGGLKYLRLEADVAFTLRTTGTAMATLGLTGGNNNANAQGRYTVADVGVISGATSYHGQLVISSKLTDPAWTQFTLAEAGPSQHFKIHRPGVQRISSTEMEDNVEGGLYYADIEVVSMGPGDEFNIVKGIQLDVEGHQSDGYLLSNEDNNLTFSVYEELRMQIGRRLLIPGNTDIPDNMTQVSQQNIQINYERSPLVSQVQDFVNSELDRVLCANILVRHLLPHFVQFDMTYQGGSKASIVIDDMTDLIDGLLPDEVLEASALANIAKRRGATRVEMPITLVGVVHGNDRDIRVERSQDAISRGRLATFIVDNLNVVRETSIA